MKQISHNVNVAALLIFTTLILFAALGYRLAMKVPTQAETVLQTKTTTVSAVIGSMYRFRLYGYTSPLALVTIEGKGLVDSTYADKNGYFEFNDGFSPVIPTEPCLTAQDQFGRLSTPLCIAPFSVENNVEIGPVLMPPTLSLDKKDYFIGDQVILSGQTIPNTEVELSTFTDDKNIWMNLISFSIIRPVEALTIPIVDIKSDREGNFSVSLPSSSTSIYRLFAQTDFLEALSPKSLTLQLEILPVWMVIFQILGLFLKALMNRILEVLILFEIGAMLLYFLRRYLHPHALIKTRALALRNSYLPAVEEKTLMVPPMHSLRSIEA